MYGDRKLAHWPTVLDILDAALTQDVEKARAYAELLAQRLEADGDTRTAASIRRRLAPDYDPGPTYYPAAAGRPATPEQSRQDVVAATNLLLPYVKPGAVPPAKQIAVPVGTTGTLVNVRQIFSETLAPGEVQMLVRFEGVPDAYWVPISGLIVNSAQ